MIDFAVLVYVCLVPIAAFMVIERQLMRRYAPDLDDPRARDWRPVVCAGTVVVCLTHVALVRYVLHME